MVDVQYDMEWRSCSPQPAAPPLDKFTSLPFEIFLELVKRIEVWDLMQLRRTCRIFYEYTNAHSVWISLAETMTKRRPIPLPSFRSRGSLTPAELQTAVCRAARLERNWLSPFGRLRAPPRVLRESGRASGDMLVLLPGGRHLVTGASPNREDGAGCVLRVWDLTTGDRIATFELRPEDDVLQWRSVDEGRAVMFLVRDGILSTRSSAQHFHLLRLELTEESNSTSAFFFHHSSLMQELPIADTSLSENVVIILVTDSDSTITMFILQWRNGTIVTVKTDVRPPEHPFFAILSLKELSIWVDSPSAPRTYSFPLSAIYPYLAYPAGPPIFLSQPTPTVLTHVSNISPSPPAGSTLLYCDTSRKWGTCSQPSLLARPLSILHVESAQGDASQRKLTYLSHEYLPTEFMPHPTNRTYFAPLAILASAAGQNEDGESPEFPLIAAEAANIVFPELLPSGEVQLRVITLPPDDPTERHRPPEWYNEHFIRPLEAPPELNLGAIVMMSLDDAAGVLAVAVDSGDIFILEY